MAYGLEFVIQMMNAALCLMQLRDNDFSGLISGEPEPNRRGVWDLQNTLTRAGNPSDDRQDDETPDESDCILSDRRSTHSNTDTPVEVKDNRSGSDLVERTSGTEIDDKSTKMTSMSVAKFRRELAAQH